MECVKSVHLSSMKSLAHRGYFLAWVKYPSGGGGALVAQPLGTLLPIHPSFIYVNVPFVVNNFMPFIGFSVVGCTLGIS